MTLVANSLLNQSYAGGNPGTEALLPANGGAGFVPNRGHTRSTVFINVGQSGTVQVYRVDSTGTNRAQFASRQNITGGTEMRVVIDYPVNELRIGYQNTTSQAGTDLSVEVVDGGSPR